MASTSTQHIILPSIQEMFPEHLMPPRHPHPAHPAVPRIHLHSPPPLPTFSFDVLRSDPRGASLQHIASSRPRPRPSSMRTSPTRSSDGDADMDEVEDSGDGEEGLAEEGKKHVCPTCGKRFNRPSSLRIHVNTHTGATPFRCPHPSCGRAFNVNSNMRRHYRNHGTPAAYSSPSPSSALGPSLHAFPVSAASPSTSPITPTSPCWSVSSSNSSNASMSPITPQSPQSYFVLPSPSPRMETPPGAWGPSSAASVWAAKGYSESDVRSERR